MRNLCGHCGQPFKPTRSDAAWCSARCRVAHHRRMRNAGVTDGRLLNLDDNIKQLQATLAGVNSVYELSTCAGWSPEQEAAFTCMRALLTDLAAEFQISRDKIAARDP